MKRIAFFILIAFVASTLASCQNKPDCDCQSAIYTFDSIPYSYKDYEVWPRYSMSGIVPVKPGDSFVALYYDHSRYMAPEAMAYLNLTELKDSVVTDDLIWTIPKFKEKVKMNYIADISIYFKGFKKSERGYKVLTTEEDISFPTETEKRMDVDLNGKKYIFNTYHDPEKNQIRTNHTITLSHDNITQCLIQIPELKLDYAEHVNIYFVGDVDGDDKLDCVIEVTQFIESRDRLFQQLFLYISSEAEEGQLVKYVAKYTGLVPRGGSI